MRVAVECRSPLLQKSLELFLSEHLCSIKQCDVLIKEKRCDDERCFVVSTTDDADLVKPFSRAQLILALERRYKQLNLPNSTLNQKMDFEILERRLASLSAEYQANVIRIVKAFYES